MFRPNCSWTNTSLAGEQHPVSAKQASSRLEMRDHSPNLLTPPNPIRTGSRYNFRYSPWSDQKRFHADTNWRDSPDLLR
jgi:hypothetical protein